MELLVGTLRVLVTGLRLMWFGHLTIPFGQLNRPDQRGHVGAACRAIPLKKALCGLMRSFGTNESAITALHYPEHRAS